MTIVSEKGTLQILKNNEYEYMTNQNAEDEAYVQALSEYQRLLAGKTEFTLKDLYEIRRYVKTRTNLEKDEASLSVEEKAWKKIYKIADDMISDNFGEEQKVELDELVRKHDNINDFQIKLEHIDSLARAVERKSIEQHARLVVHNDKGDQNAFRSYLNIQENILFKEPTATPEQKIESANSIIEMCEKYKDGFLNDLKNVSAEINQKLTIIEREIKTVKEQDDYESENIRRDVVEWSKLTREQQTYRMMALNAAMAQIEIDMMLPKIIIDNGGNSEMTLDKESMEEFTRKMATAATAMITAGEKEEELQNKKREITIRLFGDIEAEVNKEYAEQEKPQHIPQQNNFKRWLKVFGIVVLGIIFISAGADIFGYVIIIFGIAYGIKLILNK